MVGFVREAMARVIQSMKFVLGLGRNGGWFITVEGRKGHGHVLPPLRSRRVRTQAGLPI